MRFFFGIRNICVLLQLQTTTLYMDSKKAIKFYEWASYVLILAATAVFFLMEKNVSLTLLVLVVAVYLRVMMYRRL